MSTPKIFLCSRIKNDDSKIIIFLFSCLSAQNKVFVSEYLRKVNEKFIERVNKNIRRPCTLSVVVSDKVK